MCIEATNLLTIIVKIFSGLNLALRIWSHNSYARIRRLLTKEECFHLKYALFFSDIGSLTRLCLAVCSRLRIDPLSCQPLLSYTHSRLHIYARSKGRRSLILGIWGAFLIASWTSPYLHGRRRMEARSLGRRLMKPPFLNVKERRIEKT